MRISHDVGKSVYLRLTVAQDSRGNFHTVQQAIDSIPENNTTPVEIFIKNGVYKERITIPKDKPFITLIGESVESTILTYDNHAKLPTSEGGIIGTGKSASVYLYANDFTAKNLTMENSFNPKRLSGETQAVAVYASGERMSFYHIRFLGNQDTLYVGSGTQYFNQCYIEGDIDFIFGGARAVFEECEIFSLDRGSDIDNGYISAASTPIDEPFGFLFINNRFTSSAPAGTVYLGRPWHPGGDPNAIASVVFKNNYLGPHIHPEGWTDMSGFSAKEARFYEYQNEGPGANPSRPQLTDEEAKEFTVEHVLKGWIPEANR
ncbi:pectinesterase family protein [Neobacillus dielmonensis]|uniref:pectinesterase family protein n=1 Tax=Neobacillus dielmonensis TaxID=1347369 RepID=UPI0005AAE2D6|nr:pectinesterase family protein [Neobacillus dielmonensis]